MSERVPSFKSPPLNEVFLSVQYDTKDFDVTTYGFLWEQFNTEFPKVEHHSPLEPQLEKTGGLRNSYGGLPRVSLEPLDSVPLPRVWFISEDSQELIQIQPDRFIRNWRKLNENNEYPRYELHIRAKFFEQLNQLDNFYKKRELGSIHPNQCEISYINHINVGKTHAQLEDIFVGWSSQYDISDIAEVEDISLNIKHILKDEDGVFVGRLYVKIVPAFLSNDDTPIFILELKVRGRPIGEGMDGVMNFMDMGRDAIVRTFTKMTTPEMHKIWERET